MDWIDHLQARLTAGEPAEQLFQVYCREVEQQRRQDRFTPLTSEHRVVLDGWERGDWEQLAPWLDGDHLTPEGTRLLLDGWAILDQVSR